MKKTVSSNKALKKLLNLNEKDYLLKYDKLGVHDELRFDETDSSPEEEEDKTEDEVNDSEETATEAEDSSEEETEDESEADDEASDEASEETDDEEAPEEEKKEQPTEDNADDKTDDKQSNDKESKEKKPTATASSSNSVTAKIQSADLAKTYVNMQNAKTPADVGIALKSFLKLLQTEAMQNVINIEVGEKAVAEADKQATTKVD